MTGINLSKSPNFVNLQKGSQIALPGTLRVVDLMLGWEPTVTSAGHKVKDKSFLGLGRLVNALDDSVNAVVKNVDVDASALLVNAQGKVVNRVWFRNLSDRMNNVYHSGDNLTGKGAFPDETISLRDLNSIHQDIQEIHFWVNIFSGSQDFGDIQECIAAVADMEKREELARVNLTGQYPGKSSIFLCAISRAPGGGWIFNSILEAFNEKRMEDIIRNHY